MSFAVIQTGGKQYKVKASDILKIEKLKDSKPESKIEFNEVLAYGDDKTLEIGSPLVKGAKVAVKGMNRTSKWKDEQGVDVYKRFISVEYSDGGKIEINSTNAMQEQTVESAVDNVPF